LLARNGDFMKEIKLTKGYVALVDNADFESLSKLKWQACIDKNKDGSIKNIYARTSVKMHRLVLGIFDPEIKVDHKNRVGLDNQRHNLRTATNAQNAQNRKLRKGSTSGFKGVMWSAARQLWSARVQVEGRCIHLGWFSDPLEAACAYDMAAVKYFGEFASCNFAEAS